MARPAKNKAPEASAAAKPDINREAFIRVTTEFRATLHGLQGLLKNATDTYHRTTSLLLGEIENLDNGVPAVNLDNALNLLPAPVAVPVLAPAVEEKKERKKRTHDPNAPKRPLTPYFLYMQTARPIIAEDLGADAPKGAIQQEGQRRWGTMSASDKIAWDKAYQYNLRLYNARVHSYKTGGNPQARDMSDEDAIAYADEFNIPMPTGKDADAGNDQDAIAEQLQQRTQEDTPAKTPKSTKKEGASRKRKSEAVLAPAPEPVKPSPAAAAPSPEKKRKRASKVTEEKEPEPKKSGRKKAKTG